MKAGFEQLFSSQFTFDESCPFLPRLFQQQLTKHTQHRVFMWHLNMQEPKVRHVTYNEVSIQSGNRLISSRFSRAN